MPDWCRVCGAQTPPLVTRGVHCPAVGPSNRCSSIPKVTGAGGRVGVGVWEVLVGGWVWGCDWCWWEMGGV